MKNSFVLLAASMIVIATIFGCGKKAKLGRKLKGKWDVASLTWEQYYVNNCGVVGFGTIDKYTAENAGVIDFTGEETEYESAGETTYIGTMTLNYTATNLSGASYQIQNTETFFYHLWKNLDNEWQVTIENPSAYRYESWPLAELERKSFETSISYSYDCHGEKTTYVLEKQ